MNSNTDILDILLDEENKDPILLTDFNGNSMSFEQIAVIPHNGKVYCILKPLEKAEHIAEDEAIVFCVEETDDDESYLRVETDEHVALSVFDDYYNLLESHGRKKR